MKKTICMMLLLAAFGLSAQAQDERLTLKYEAAAPEVNLPRETFDAGGDQVDVYLLRHATVVLSVKHEGKKFWIYVDPLMEHNDAEVFYENLPRADAVLLTHAHYDHMSEPAIFEHSKESTVVIGPKCCAEQLSTIKVMGDKESMILANNIVVYSVPAYNTTKDHLKFHPKGVGNGYIIIVNNDYSFYFAGDTEPTPEMKDIVAKKKPVLALLPVNQPYTMTPAQCVEAAKVIKPQVLIPYHIGDTDISELKKMQQQLPGVEIRLRDDIR